MKGIIERFNQKAAIQAIDYIVRACDKYTFSLDKMSILKLLFFAERYSLRKFAISITGDFFIAMKNGPVASQTYDLLKFKNYAKGLAYAKKALKQEGEYAIKSLGIFLERDDYDELSDGDLEALDFAIDNFGKYSALKLSDISHRYLEWVKASRDGVMDFADFFAKDDENSAEFNVIPYELVKHSKELYFERD